MHRANPPTRRRASVGTYFIRTFCLEITRIQSCEGTEPRPAGRNFVVPFSLVAQRDSPFGAFDVTWDRAATAVATTCPSDRCAHNGTRNHAQDTTSTNDHHRPHGSVVCGSAPVRRGFDGERCPRTVVGAASWVLASVRANHQIDWFWSYVSCGGTCTHPLNTHLLNTTLSIFTLSIYILSIQTLSQYTASLNLRSDP